MSLENYFAEQIPFPISTPEGWWDIPSFQTFCLTHAVDPLLRVLLCSDGSLVKNLSALYLTPVQFKVWDQVTISLDRDLGKVLERPEGSPAIARSVWMTWNLEAGASRQVFAHAVIDSSTLDNALLQGLQRQKQPVGSLLEDLGEPALRDQLHIGRVKASGASGLPGKSGWTPHTESWGRTYRLRTATSFRAIILEVLSPGIP